MLDLVDTHCHIQSAGLGAEGGPGERITQELWAKEEGLTGDDIVKAAAEAGVKRLICVGCSLTDSQLVANFVQNRPGCWASIGIHPHEAQNHPSGRKIPEFAALAIRPKVVAIGECGLDFYYDHSPRSDQFRVLEFQLALAEDSGLPVIFHVREAFDEFWRIFDGYKNLRGVVHSFTDSAANLAKALDRGLYVGVNGITTFTKDPALLEVYKAVPPDRLLLETDSPFLSPKPHRGKTNQPKRLVDVANFLAGLRNERPADLAATTTANAIRLFGI